MNPVVQELRRKMHQATTPSWANRAADEIERLERERGELKALNAELIQLATAIAFDETELDFRRDKARELIDKHRGQS